MTLEAELIEKGFTAFGPVTESEMGECLNRLLKKSPQPVYLKVIQGRLVRDDMDDVPHLYMIYHTSDLRLLSS